jgi:hypothetical protein
MKKKDKNPILIKQAIEDIIEEYDDNGCKL